VALDVNSNLHVAVTDDGVGLGSRIGTGVGLASMRERAAELGGQVELSSREAGGTRVTATLPLAADS
jgi:signal transduction histidine kinase